MTRRTIAAIIGSLAVVFAGLALLPQLLYPPLTGAELQGVPGADARIQLQQAQGRLRNDVRSTLLQFSAGLLVIAGATATWRQVQVNRDGQLTERFTKAVDQLGSDNSDVRVGGIYSLERIARNSPPDRNTIEYLLGAFVRNHSPWPVGAPGGPAHPTPAVDEQLPWMRVRAADVQAAMGVLGRRTPTRDEPVVYLSRVDLRSVALRKAHFVGAQFRYANLARAVLAEARLDRADLTGVDLRRAYLERVRLARANLTRAHLQEANLRDADLSHADLRGANLTGAVLDRAVLTGALANRTTTWPEHVDEDRRRELGIIEIDAPTDGDRPASAGESGTPGSSGGLDCGMSVDLEQVRALSLRENGLATVATTRADGTVHSSVVNAGVLEDPVTGAPGVAYVAVGRAHKLALLRRAGHATVTFRRGWNWVSVTGATHLIGPDDPDPAFDPAGLPKLLRDVFKAATGTHDDWDEYDRVMAEERRVAVFVTADRIIGNP